MKTLRVLLLLLSLPLSTQSFSAACNANSYATFDACLASNTTVNVSADIALTADQNIFLVDLSNVVINGNGHTITETEAGYLAGGVFNAFMVRIQRSGNISIRDLHLRSPSSRHAECKNGGIYYIKAPCAGAIAVIDSNTVEFAGLDIDMEKTFLLQISGSAGVDISDSQFRNAATYGIWTSVFQSRRINIVNSYFEHVGANAIMLNNVHGASIRNNHFYNNHWDNQYSGFGGGQVAMEDVGDSLADIDIVGNLFQGGSSPYSMGIEFAHFDDASWISGRITSNRIEAHAGTAIKLNTRDENSDLRQLKIEGNQLIDNFVYQGSQIETRGHVFLDIDSNPQTNGGITKNGSFRGTAKTCSLNGKSRCTVAIQWNSSGLEDPRIYIRSSLYGGRRHLFATQASGNIPLPWVNASGGIIELVEGNGLQPLASISIKAEP